MSHQNQIPPFYVGQEVVAIKSHSVGMFKKGDEFIVTSIINGCCGWDISIGLGKGRSYIQSCSLCGSEKFYTGEYFFNAMIFAPKQKFQAITFTKIMEQEPASVN